MTKPIVQVQTTRDHAQIAAALKQCFKTDPVITWMLNASPPKKREKSYDLFFDTITKTAAFNGACFLQANHFQGAAIWMPPGRKIDSVPTYFRSNLVASMLKLGRKTVLKLLFEFSPIQEKAKKRAISNGRPTWYLFMIGTLDSARGQGLCSALIKSYFEKANKEQANLYLEASSPKSRDIYAHLGFVVQEEVRLGKGNTGEDGKPLKDGPGVPLWTMLRVPQGKA